MQRREVNTTCVDGRSQGLNWRVEFNFVGASTTGVAPIARSKGTVVIARAAQDATWAALLAAQLAPDRPGAAVLRHTLREYVQAAAAAAAQAGAGEEEAGGSALAAAATARVGCETNLAEGGAVERAAGAVGSSSDPLSAPLPPASRPYHLLLQRLPGAANERAYYDLDPSRSIREALAGKVVIEFPTVLVVLPAELAAYVLVPPPIAELACGA
jgi:hypothetical protein